MSNEINEYGLNVHLLSFNISPEYIKGSEIIVNVSTKPVNFKDTFSIPIEFCDKINHDFLLNIKIPSEQVNKIIKGQTELIIFTFRIKSKFNSKRKIAVATIHPQDFPKIQKSNDFDIISSSQNEIKTINIYKTSKDQKKEYYEALQNGNANKYEITDNFTLKRDSIGKMKIQLSLNDPFTNLYNNNIEFRTLKSQNDFGKRNSKYGKLL